MTIINNQKKTNKIIPSSVIKYHRIARIATKADQGGTEPGTAINPHSSKITTIIACLNIRLPRTTYRVPYVFIAFVFHLKLFVVFSKSCCFFSLLLHHTGVDLEIHIISYVSVQQCHIIAQFVR